MLKSQREQEILSVLKQSDGFVSVKNLCKQLFASESSIRRDLTDLENKGYVKRSYGGAQLVSDLSKITVFNFRYAQHAQEKTEIAKKAVSLIKDNSVIFLDQSSTSCFLAKELPNKSSLTVITNSVEILNILSPTKIKVFCSGGTLSQDNRSCLIGGDAEKTFNNAHADFAFFSCNALSNDGEISDCTREEVLVRQTMLNNAKVKVFLCNGSKFGTTSIFKQCSLKEVDYLISEGDKSKQFIDKGFSVNLL